MRVLAITKTLLEVELEEDWLHTECNLLGDSAVADHDTAVDTQIETIVPEMCATKVQPDAATLADMQFGWNIVKHVKSNAIVVVKNGQTLGVGAGQMNRVGSAEIAMKQAHAAGVTEGLILASDGFLPFDDTVALAAQYGVTAIVQPGGSIRDNDCVVKADELGICMLMTGTRHFKH